MAVPRAPIPTQTAYAVPIGSVCAAFANKNMLPANVIIVNRLGNNIEKPFVYFKPMAQHISNSPAKNFPFYKII